MSTSHDQNFKNLIIDYPRQALAFFAPIEAASLPSDVKITYIWPLLHPSTGHLLPHAG